MTLKQSSWVSNQGPPAVLPNSAKKGEDVIKIPNNVIIQS